LDFLKEKGVSLVVTVDCGITAVSEVEYGKTLGMEFIITDHHECKGDLPDAVAVIDPKQPDCSYPNRHLAGVGVAFKLVCAMQPEGDLESLLYTYSDLIAIGTVADVMPVLGENRVLIRAGLKRLSDNPRPGLVSLLQAAGSPRSTINTASIGFSIAPRLNAAGRMGNADLSLSILMTDSPEEADALTAKLTELNDKRRELEREIFEDVKSKLEASPPTSLIVMADEKWYHGVMGIIAARTAEKWMLPAVMINIGCDGIGRGSCRSYGMFGMYSALSKCSDLLLNFGGHEMAAGITIETEKIPQFRERIQHIFDTSDYEPPKPVLRIDFEVEKPALLSLENIESLECLEPFGNGNPAPCLSMRGARIVSLMGVGSGKHSRIRIEKDHASFDCLFFSSPPESLGVVEGSAVDIAFDPQINEFRKRKSVQLNIIDIIPHKRG